MKHWSIDVDQSTCTTATKCYRLRCRAPPLPPQVSSPPAEMHGPQMGHHGGGGRIIYRLDSQCGVSENRNSFAAGQIIANCNARVRGLPEVLGHFVPNPPQNAVKNAICTPSPVVSSRKTEKIAPTDIKKMASYNVADILLASANTPKFGYRRNKPGRWARIMN